MVLGRICVNFPMLHKPDAPARDCLPNPSLALRACVAGHGLRKPRELPFGASKGNNELSWWRQADELQRGDVLICRFRPR